MRIVAYKTSEQNGKVLLEESTGESVLSNDVTELFTFLVNQFEDDDTCIKICWNLDQFVSLFLRLLGEEQCLKLKNTKRGHIAPFDIFYVQEKVFSIVHIPTREKANLYGLEQFFPELEEPDLNDLKSLGEILLAELKKMGMEPTKLTSPVAIYEEGVMRNIDLPKLKSIPLDVADYSYHVAGRLWIESFTIGMHDEVFDYDLKSAHPEVAKDLYDTRQCWWKPSKEYQPKAIYGYVKARMTIDNRVVISPIIMETEEGCSSPVGTWEGYFSKGELDFVDKWKIGHYEILNGYWAIPVNGATLTKPLLEPMTKLLEYKQGSPLQRLIAKRASNGLYGKFLEDRGEEFGPHFFPPYGAEISTTPKLKVAEFLYRHHIGPRRNKGSDALLHVGVDGVMLTKEVEYDGDWKEDYRGSALIWSSGLVYTNRTKPKGLSLAEVLSMVKAHPRSVYYHKKLKRRLTLADSLAQKRLGDIGKEMEFNVSLSLINPRHDRVFLKLPQNGGQLLKNKYRSRPRRA